MKKKTSHKKKGPVKLKEKSLKDGRKSLYLEIYYDGQRHKEFLGMYLEKADFPTTREHNRQILEEAEGIRNKRLIEFYNNPYESLRKDRSADICFLDYFRKKRDECLTDGRSQKTWSLWNGCLQLLKQYCDEGTTFRDVTPEFVKGFKEFLDRAEKKSPRDGHVYKGKPLSQNTKFIYFTKFRACINQALAEGIIKKDPMLLVKGISKQEVRKEYLTIDELRRLPSTPCWDRGLKRAFLFSCLTGLRKSDILKLTWGEVYIQTQVTRIIFRQKKTDGLEYLDLNPQAVKCMGKRHGENERVFSDFLYDNRTSGKLQAWCASAGITKRITFHCARHTFAVMMLELGADIYTVSKLLGHKDIATTQVYAKILDARKRELISRIPCIKSSRMTI